MNRVKIDRALVKAEIIITDALVVSEKEEDQELVKALRKLLENLYNVRALCWPDD